MTFQNIEETVAVGFNIYPRWVKWQGRVYPITKIGLHHTYRQGETLFHVFSVTTATFFMRLVLNTENLFWKLEQISDNAN